ncbi:c-type cytochrome [Polynucleobacter paludilacus]|uniref:c-type cytochrome n=1 Tax=Polynucleobacter paludilacus TaxID=1855895 RepID=UPI00210C0C49|nr:c-type cytochrome [Polynucleobacter paludilacus]
MKLVRVCAKAILFTFIFCSLRIPQVHASSDNEKAYVIAKQNACLGCHAVNKKIVGPSYQDVAKKYQGNTNAVVYLKNKIRHGGVGAWGVVPMPANTKLSDAELSILSAWILQGAPTPR